MQPAQRPPPQPGEQTKRIGPAPGTGTRLRRAWPLMTAGVTFGVALLGVLANLSQILAFLGVTPAPVPAGTAGIPAYSGPAVVVPTPETRTFQVAASAPTGVLVDERTVVEVRAYGTVRVGGFVGSVAPDGRVANMGFSLAQYNLAAEYPHGALIYRLAGDQSWQLCGSRCTIAVPPGGAGGELEFEINDRDQRNNTGAFEVEITVTRSSN